MIPYANMAPVRALGCPAGFTFIYITPRQSVDALIDGRVVAAALPTGALLAKKDHVEPLGAYGVAASGSVGSVFLYSKKDINALCSSDQIHLTGQSATSVLLLYLVLRFGRQKNAMPGLCAEQSNSDAMLLIGDDALVEREKNGYPFCYDLATLWYDRFQKPMVFCRWVVRRDASSEVKARLLAWLGELDRRDNELVEQSALNEARRLGVAREKMLAYLKGMHRVFDAEDLAGQELFLKEAGAVFMDYLAWRKSVTVPGSAPLSGASKRVDRAQSHQLLRDTPLGEVMAMAHEDRMRRHPGGLVSFVMDTNPNYTNICNTNCTFCAFHRSEDSKDAYTLTPAELVERVRRAASNGATTVLLQGGSHNGVSMERMLDYIRQIQAVCPKIHIHPFSPSEIDAVARLENKPVDYVLNALWDEGIHTIPGGGAEILSDRVRRIVSPAKCSADRWLEIMEAAHRIGFRTTATMMYGHVESEDDIVEHLFRLRDVQDRTGGFSSFIAWSFKPGHSPLSNTVPVSAHSALYVRIISVARVVLDNFEHIQSSWFSESENAGCLGLMSGADDFGGILVEENVLRTTGHDRRTTVENVKELISRSGFVPARRDSDYRILEVYDS